MEFIGNHPGTGLTRRSREGNLWERQKVGGKKAEGMRRDKTRKRETDRKKKSEEERNWECVCVCEKSEIE